MSSPKYTSINVSRQFPRLPQTPETSMCGSTTPDGEVNKADLLQEATSKVSVDDMPGDTRHANNLNISPGESGYELEEELVHGDVKLVESHEPLIVVPESAH